MRALPSTGLTRLRRYYDPLRLPAEPSAFHSVGVHSARPGVPPIAQTTFPAGCAPITPPVRVSVSSRLLLPSQESSRVGVHHLRFEACSGFTRVTACRVAQPSYGTFVTRPNPLPDSRLSAARLYRLLSGWDFHPLAICAVGAHLILQDISALLDSVPGRPRHPKKGLGLVAAGPGSAALWHAKRPRDERQNPFRPDKRGFDGERISPVFTLQSQIADRQSAIRSTARGPVPRLR